jgi:glycosyltransferase involved in cell wall biosynthesis
MSNSNTGERLRIALITALDVFDRRSWSGTFYYMTRALQEHCGDVTFIGPMDASREMLTGMLVDKGAKLLLKKQFAFRHTFSVSKRYAQIASKRLAHRSFDVIIALSGATELAFLQTSTPTVLIEDANFALLRNYHAHFSSLLESSAYQLHSLQAKGISKADLILYSTKWAAQSAIDHYAADERKIRVIPFGANLEHVPSRERVLARKKNEDCCRLLFVGVDWEKKGASIALETLIALEEFGISAELTVCGCVPPKNVSHPKMKVIPFLNKNDDQQRQKLEMLYMQSDFFILPTRNECFGIVFCEASAFALPSLGTRTGGVSEVIQDGVNGFTLPHEARGEAYAEVIARLYHDTPVYNHLVRASRERFETQLNWDTWGQIASLALSEMLERQKYSVPLVHS